MKKGTAFLVSAIFLLLGIIIGLSLFPIKHGITFGGCVGKDKKISDDDEDQEQ